MKERRPSGEPVLAEVGPPVILSLGIAGYLSVSQPSARAAHLSGGSTIRARAHGRVGIVLVQRGGRP